MLKHNPKPEFAQEPEEHYLLERIELPSVPLTLSYYITVNTSYSATNISVPEYGIEIQQKQPPDSTIAQRFALCISPDQDTVEELLHFMALHTVTPLQLQFVLEDIWLETDQPHVPPVVLTVEEQRLLSDAQRKRLPLLSSDLQKLEQQEARFLSDNVCFYL